jgi:hypothetical protein
MAVSLTPFHDGEKRIQVLTGEDRIAARNSRFIRNTLVANSNSMLDAARTLNIALSDTDRDVWSFVATGNFGLIRRIDDTTAFIDSTSMTVPETIWPLLSTGAQIGLVAMDLTSARRFRINGVVGDVRESGFDVKVAQTCPNCPKYIQQRRPVIGHTYPHVVSRTGSTLDTVATELITKADTFFVASRDMGGGHDASHRGGLPGFVSVRESTLIIPDYIGNSMFMTLGNFLQDPAAGLTFVDFENGAQLNLTGAVSISLEDPEAHDGNGGRFWTFETKRWRYEPFRPNPSWEFVAHSRFNPIQVSKA